MSPLGGLSIRGKLVAIILLTTSLSLLGGFAFVIVNDTRTFRTDMADGTVTMARLAADHSVSALAFGDRREAARLLATLGSVPSVEAAHLYDARGALFASFDRRGKAAEAPPVPPRGSLSAFSADRLDVFEPVAYQNESYGTIHLEASTAPLEAKIRRHLAVMLSALAVLILASVLFALRLQRIISAPILRLAETARWISRVQDYSVRVERMGADEIGVLCDGFNDMLGELGRKNAELKEKSAMLESLYRQEREVTRNLQELSEMKTSFLVVSSHELRTPLTIIRGYTEALVGGMLGRMTDVQQRSLAACQRMVNRMAETLENIQQMLDINDGLSVARTASVDVRALAREILDGLAPFVEQRRQRARFEAKESLHVAADRDKLEIVLVNLIQNAIKFTADGGEIRVAVEALPEGALIRVEDNGIGIEPSALPHIFERFYTSPDPLHHRSGSYQFEARGSGLGLAIAKSYVEAHGGRIWAESAGLGKGSAFHVVIPYTRKEQGAAVQAAP